MPHHQPDCETARTIVEMMPLGVVVQDASGAIQSFNQAALAALELTADQLRGRTSVDPSWMAVDARMQPFPGERHPAMRCIATGTPQIGVVMGVRTPASTTRWLRIDSYPTTVDGGAGAITLFSDITAEHQADDELRRQLRILQQSLLPGSERVGRNVRSASWYRAAGGASMVGGDFYDVVDVVGGSIFFIGDIAGHGVEAMAATALARYTLRAAAVGNLDPASALQLLNESFLAEGGGHLCTAIYGVAEESESGLAVHLGIAGHPLPLLMSAGGTAAVGQHGPLLGIPAAGVPWPVEHLTVAPGSQLLCYTDGLTDTVRPRLDDDQLASLVTLADTPAETIEATLRALPGSWIEGADDVAIVVLAPAV